MTTNWQIGRVWDIFRGQSRYCLRILPDIFFQKNQPRNSFYGTWTLWAATSQSHSWYTYALKSGNGTVCIAWRKVTVLCSCMVMFLHIPLRMLHRMIITHRSTTWWTDEIHGAWGWFLIVHYYHSQRRGRGQLSVHSLISGVNLLDQHNSSVFASFISRKVSYVYFNSSSVEFWLFKISLKVILSEGFACTQDRCSNTVWYKSYEVGHFYTLVMAR